MSLMSWISESPGVSWQREIKIREHRIWQNACAPRWMGVQTLNQSIFTFQSETLGTTSRQKHTALMPSNGFKLSRKKTKTLFGPFWYICAVRLILPHWKRTAESHRKSVTSVREIVFACSCGTCALVLRCRRDERCRFLADNSTHYSHILNEHSKKNKKNSVYYYRHIRD